MQDYSLLGHAARYAMARSSMAWLFSLPLSPRGLAGPCQFPVVDITKVDLAGSERVVWAVAGGRACVGSSFALRQTRAM